MPPLHHSTTNYKLPTNFKQEDKDGHGQQEGQSSKEDAKEDEKTLLASLNTGDSLPLSSSYSHLLTLNAHSKARYCVLLSS